MKNKYSLSIIGILLILAMLCSFLALPVSAAEEAEAAALAKIDPNLMKQLSKIDDSDKVDVSVWFKDIDQDKFEDEVKAEVKDKIDNKKLDSKIIKVFDKNLSADELHNELKDIDQSEFQDIVEIKRKIHVNKQEKTIQSFLIAFFQRVNGAGES